MGIPRKRKCPHCKKLFRPDPRNGSRQKYCTLPECRKASKAASQKKWLEKPENHDYFRGPEHTERVRQWRRRHPGYWRNQQKRQKQQEPLQDPLIGETTEDQQDDSDFASHALQDLLLAQPTVFLGLLAQLGGSPLQDDIVAMGRRLQQLGQDILSQSFCPKGGRYDSQQSSHPPAPGAAGP